MAKGSAGRGKTLQTSYVRIAPSFEGSGEKLKREIGKVLKDAFSDVTDQLKDVNQKAGAAAEEIAKNVGDGLSGVKVDPSKGLNDLQDSINKIGTTSAKSARGVGQRIGSALSTAMESKTVRGVKKVGNGITKAFGGTMLAGVGALGVAGGVAISKGLSRSLNIEDAKAKLKGLGYSMEEINGVMDSVGESVTGTAYGLDEMASVSATALASGVQQGEPLTDYLKKIADTATITGSSVGEIGSIFNKVTAGGVMSAEEINQLQDRGLGIGSMLAKQLGVSQTEIKKLSSQGKISSDIFLKSFGQIEGAAQSSGDTVRGSFANMLAAMGRVGESSLKAVMPAIQPLLKSVTEGLDYLNNEILKPNADNIATNITPKLVAMAQAIGPMLVKIFTKAKPILTSLAEGAGKSFTKLMDNMGELKKYFKEAGGDLGGSFMSSLSSLSKALGDLLAELVPVVAVLGTSTFATFFQAISLGSVILASVLPLITSLLDFLNSFPGLLSTLTVLFLGLYGVIQLLTVIQTITTLLTALRGVTIASTLAQIGLNTAMLANPITWIVVGIIALIAAIVLLVKNWDVISEAAMTLWTNITGWFGDIFGAIGGWFSGLWEAISGFFSGIAESVGMFIATVSLNIWGFFAGIFTAIGGFFASIIEGLKASGMAAITWLQTTIATIIGWITGVWGNVVSIASAALGMMTGAIGGAVSAIGGFFSGLWARILGVFNMIRAGVTTFIGMIGTGVGSAVSTIAGVFTNLWGKISGILGNMKQALGNVWGGFINLGKIAIAGMLAPINGLIDMVNGAFSRINKLKIKMPNGSTFGINIPVLAHVQVPGLAQGGVVSARAGGTPVILGEGGRDEAVTDLGLLNNLIAKTNNRLDGEGGQSEKAGTSVTINLTVPEGANVKEWADKLQAYWEYQA